MGLRTVPQNKGCFCTIVLGTIDWIYRFLSTVAVMHSRVIAESESEL